MSPLKEEEFVWVRSDRYTPVIKKMAEQLFFIYQKDYKMDLLITRLSRIYGPDYPEGRPITRMIAAALRGEEANLNDINGNEGHDFLYVRDCARAIALVHFSQKPKHAIYNIGSGELVKFSDMARVLEKLFPGLVLNLGKGGQGTRAAIDYIPKTDYDIEACLDISRIKEEFGFVPEYSLEKGLSALIAWAREGVYL